VEALYFWPLGSAFELLSKDYAIIQSAGHSAGLARDKTNGQEK
jgi:hypothetical protein